MSYPVVLTVPVRRTRDGRTPVVDGEGDLVATVSPPTRQYRFDVEDPDGNVLCTGRMRTLSGWELLDPSGAPLARIGPGLFGRYRVRLRNDEMLLGMTGRAYRGDFRVQDPAAQTRIESVTNDGAYALGDDWLIRSDGTLTVAELLGVIELHRLEMRRRRKPSRWQRRRRRKGWI